MNEDTRRNLTDTGIWKRILFMLLFALLYQLAELVLAAVAVIQVLFRLISGETNPRLRDLGHQVSRYVYAIWMYLTFNTEHRPFPFSDWPSGDDPDSTDLPHLTKPE